MGEGGEGDGSLVGLFLWPLVPYIVFKVLYSHGVVYGLRHKLTMLKLIVSLYSVALSCCLSLCP